MTTTDLHRDGGTTRLKWHRARRIATDPPFSLGRVVEGLACGASVEIDVRAGTGGVPLIRHDALRWWRRRAVTERSTPLSAVRDALVDVGVTRLPASASLQLDLKDTARVMSPAAAERVAAAVAPFAAAVTVSGTDPAAVARVTAWDARLATGHDPCTRAAVRRLRRTGDVMGFVADALDAAPSARMIYLDHRIILALAERDRDPADIVAAFHAAGRTVDAYTLGVTDTAAVAAARALLGLAVDQITTDDPERLARALE